MHPNNKMKTRSQIIFASQASFAACVKKERVPQGFQTNLESKNVPLDRQPP